MTLERVSPAQRSSRPEGEPASTTVPAPALTLPKGGGAIRGIAEKFAANAVTGAGSLTIPIAASAGRSGFGPELTLGYDSANGNGPFGFGWSLSLASISRKTSKGLPRYADDEDSDVFILSASEDLVPLYRQDPDGSWIALHPGYHRDPGEFWVRDSAGSFVAHEDDIEGYRVRRYRPRIEGLFARIERWTKLDDPSDVHWQSLSKDNVLTVYGGDSDSRIADPLRPTHIFQWLICEVRDDKGNAIFYRYKPEDGAGADLSAAHERNRGALNDARRKANRYPKRIHYGNRKTLLDNAGKRPRVLDKAAIDLQIANGEWMFEIVFDYGEHDPDAPTPNDAGEWSYRADAFSSYRSAFEVRTTRICRRVLVYHHFQDEEGVGRGCLVRSTDFTYSFEVDPTDVRKPVYTFLCSVGQTGYRRKKGGYDRRSMPSVEFEYTQPVVQDTVADVDFASLENLPSGLDGSVYRWVDLHGEGIPGLLSEQGGAWFYKRNLSPLPTRSLTGDLLVKAQFAPVEVVAGKPNGLLGGGAEILDLAGDGRPDFVILEGPAPGLYEHDDAEGWQDFRAFTSRLNRELRDPNLRFVDLDGDGRADVLITGDDAFLWHESLGDAGFGPSQRLVAVRDEERGPRVLFADAAQSIYLADLSGDGLADIVRIRNGEICYWPNLGYGGFGAKVTMDNSPWFDQPDQFDQSRIRLADIDGSGTTDVIYLHKDGVRLYFNQSGNSWSRAHTLAAFPRVDNIANIQALDLLGNGTACLVWSSPLLADGRQPMRYVNLMGEKPHLLVRVSNNLGGETRVAYSPSTKFYLQDRLAGNRWITKLPFPVHVVERAESIDHISGRRFVSTYAYRHGYFDGEEREFRGFGMVEQRDTESFEDYVAGAPAAGSHDLTPELYQPPVTTRTWFHLGAFENQSIILNQYRHEYYGQTQHLPEPTLPAGMTPEEMRESVRSLKGLVLRREVYSFDGSPQQEQPYQVAENNYEIRRVQPRCAQPHAVFFAVGKESVAFHYERDISDPRISHTFALDLDEYGNARKACAVVYDRKIADPALPGEVTAAQQQMYVKYVESDYTPDIEQPSPNPAYRLRVPYESRGYEITGISPNSGLFQTGEIAAEIAAASAIDYEIVADGVTSQKRLLSQTRTLFLDNALHVLPLGQWDSLGLTHQRFQLAFTPGVVALHYGGAVSAAEFTAAGYAHFNHDANWWIPSGTPIYTATAAAHFYLASGARDALGLETIATLDTYDLLVTKVQVTQAAWNVVTAVNDYRVLGPIQITDPNGNRSAVEQDELGMVVKTALMGKPGAGEGDTLGDPTTRMEYELFNWVNHRKPNFVHSFAREQYGGANTRWQESYVYSNGTGSVAMIKAQAHPGKALQVGPEGTAIEVDADPRWIGNGRTIVNNKGKIVKQYQPYYSVTHEYEDEKALRELGTTPLFFYDPLGRHVRSEFPDGTFGRVEIHPWFQRVFDANDCVKESAWYAARGSPDPNAEPEPLNDPERRAAWLAAKHASTPAVTHFDSVGRAVYAVSDYGGGKTAAIRAESDLTGRTSKLFDQEGREASSGFAAMSGTRILDESAEKGRRWIFKDVLGGTVKTWDEHGRKFRAVYDVLHRLLSSFGQEPGAAEILFHYVFYGDRVANADQRNLLGVAYRIYDQAGMVRVPEFDFSGAPKSTERVLAKDYINSIDWGALALQPDEASLRAAADPALETGEVFTFRSEHDAVNRPTRITLPGGTVVEPAYNESNFVARLRAQIMGGGGFVDFLKSQDYDAKGQRQFAQFGNDVFTRYSYDSETLRLTNLVSYKSGEDPATQALQSLQYTYDPVGNITQIADGAQQTYYFANAVVRPQNLYEYDATYQLIRAAGRELAGLGNDTLRTESDLEIVGQLPHINNADAVRTYTEEYEYDLLGNIKTLKHRFLPQPGIGSGWTRYYRYAFDEVSGNRTNRLTATNLPGDADAGPYSGVYQYDAYGNMTRMPHLAAMDWNFLDQLEQIDLGGGGTAYYRYGMGGQRLRKVIERNGNVKLEWIFLGAVTIFRKRRRDTNALRFERYSAHISDRAGHIAQVDTKTRDDDGDDPANPLNTALIRYQFANHLGSAILETDGHGDPISYEEYHPYGTTSYRSAKPGASLSLKRYRFSGKEMDDETGLYYFGARYYAPWLGRWTSADPAGLVDGPNLFAYTSNRPVMMIDPTGMEGEQYSTIWRYNPNKFSGAERAIINNPKSDPAQVLQLLQREGYNQGGTLEWKADFGPKGGWVRVQPVAPGGGGGAGGVLPGQPGPGEFGSVAPMNKQPPATYGTPGDRSTIQTENEHTIPGQQLRDFTKNPQTGVSDYDDKAYKNDATLRVERDMALNKTHGNRGGPTADNPRTAALQANINAGVNYREDIFEASRQNALRAARATGSVVTEEQINRAILEQEGNLFNTYRGSVMNALPPQTFGQRVGESMRNFGRSIVYTTSGQNRFAGVGTTLARGLIPGFVEAEMGAMAAPYVVSSLGITNATLVSTAGAAAAAPAAAASVVVASAVGGYVVGSIVGDAVTEATGSKAAGVGAGTLAGAATGALIGAAIGSVVPVLGTAAGAIIGGAVGAIAGFIGSYW